MRQSEDGTVETFTRFTIRTVELTTTEFVLDVVEPNDPNIDPDNPPTGPPPPAMSTIEVIVG